MGNFKNNGREWQAKGADTTVNVYGYLLLADGRAVPYGTYDLAHNQGLVNVGIGHDMAEFAVESIRRWQQYGKGLYPEQTKLLIAAEGGSSNVVRSRLWKREMQCPANETGLTITVCYFPPGTCKWNRIEYQLFSYISINWRVNPMISLETIIERISHATSKEGLIVTAVKDSYTYPTGIKVIDEELKALHIIQDAFRGEWNYTFVPQASASEGYTI
jgi:hypothetical protein